MSEKPKLSDAEELRTEAREYAAAQPDDGCRCGAWHRGECGCGLYRSLDDYEVEFYAGRIETMTAAIREVLALVDDYPRNRRTGEHVMADVRRTLSVHIDLAES